MMQKALGNLFCKNFLNIFLEATAEYLAEIKWNHDMTVKSSEGLTSTFKNFSNHHASIQIYFSEMLLSVIFNISLWNALFIS